MHPPISIAEDHRLEYRSIHHRRVAVLNPYCDLYWDYESRTEPEQFPWVEKLDWDEIGEDEGPVPYVVLCDVFEDSEIRDPDKGINSKVWRRITKHQHDRYHTLPPGNIEGDDQTLPLLVLDFKRIFTLPTRLFYPGLNAEGVDRIARVPAVYREAMIQRFVAFQGRVSLPDLE